MSECFARRSPAVRRSPPAAALLRCSPVARTAAAGSRRAAGVGRSGSTAICSDPNVVVLDVRSAIDGGGAEAYAQGAHPGRGPQRLRQGRLARDAQRRAVHAAERCRELEKLIGELGIDEDTHVVVVPAGVSVHRFRLGRARLLDAQGRGPPAVVDPRRRLSRPGRRRAIRSRRGRAQPSPKIFTATLDKALLAELARRARRSRSRAARRWSTRGRPSFFTGKEQGADAAKAYGHIPGAINVDSATFYDPATNRLKPTGGARRDRRDAAGRPGGDLLQHRPLGGDRLVRAVRDCSAARTCGSMTARWSSGPQMPSRPIASSRTKWDDLKKTLGFGS